jgi:hypothetical protein
MYFLRKFIGFIFGSLVIIMIFPGVYSEVFFEGDEAQIEVDEGTKYVYPGEEAIFVWYVKNNDDTSILEFHPSADPERNTFEPGSIKLKPGEAGQIKQIFNTTGLNASYHEGLVITWTIHWYGPFGLVKGPSDPASSIEGRLEVIILDNETDNSTSDSGNNNDSLRLKVLILIAFCILILLFLIIGYIIRRKIIIEK